MKFVSGLVFGLSLICCTLAWAIRIDDHKFTFWLYAVAIAALSFVLFRAFSYAYVKHKAYKMLDDFLEKFRITMRTGNDTLGLPILDPFTADKIPIAIDDEMIKLDAQLENLKVDGLSTYKVNMGDLKIISMKLMLNLSWPLITASTDYDMNGKADNFEIYGKGDMKISPQDFSFETEISFTINGEYLQVKDMKLKISLRALDFKATGLFDDEELSELLSAVISDMVPQLIVDYHDTITDKAVLLITDKLNAFLSTVTLKELLKLIGI